MEPPLRGWGVNTSPVDGERLPDDLKEEDMSMKIRGFVALAGLAASAVVASAVGYSIDDGTAEDSVGVNPGPAQSVFLNTFSLTGGDTVIDQISIAYGTPAGLDPSMDGLPVTILLYSDPTGGTPWDSTLVWSLNTTIAGQGTNTFQNYAVPNIAVGTNFAVGFLFDTAATPNRFPAAFDQSAPNFSGRSFAGFDTPANSVNINDLAGSIPAGNRAAIEAFGLVGNWLIRANGAVPTPGAASLLGLAGLAGLRRRR